MTNYYTAPAFYIRGSVQRNSLLIRSSNVAKFGHVGGGLLFRYYDLYQRLQLQFYVLLMMGAMYA
jgi:hypothetical protein